jgi:oligo-1,6-glucosidase
LLYPFTNSPSFGGGRGEAPVNRKTMTDPEQPWWKETIIYQIYPRSFKDSDGDGVGDLRGIIEKLDYLLALGVETLWLCPTFRSPNADNGYDISDYRAIMEDFGTMEDFDELLAEMKKRGLRLLLDLVVNHTSDEHPWFVESRKGRDNPYRDYYIWQPGRPVDEYAAGMPETGAGLLPPTNWRSFFSGPAWEYDAASSEYYLHLFAVKQPDLNWENPLVREEVYNLMRFWLDKGVDGFRLDVVTYFSKDPNFHDHDYSGYHHLSKHYHSGPRIHDYLQEMNREVLAFYPGLLTVGEAPGVTAEEALLYAGRQRGELSMVFLFDHMRLDRELTNVHKRRAEGYSLAEFKHIFAHWDQVLGEQGWNTIYLGNHDFPRIVSRWGNDHQYRVPSAKLLATLLLTMRGTPCLYQGDEIGMTNGASTDPADYEDVSLRNALKELETMGGDMEAFMAEQPHVSRDNARFPMQWDDGPNAGFTTAEKPWLRVNGNYTTVNVRHEQETPDSILEYYRRMIALRKSQATLIYGTFQDLLPEDPHLFAYTRTLDHDIWLVTLNMSDHHVDFTVPKNAVLGEPEIANYPHHVNGPEHGLLKLRPWEARVYRVG